MRPNINVNIIIMVLVGLMAYGMTIYMDTRTPSAPPITISPTSPFEVIEKPAAAAPFTITDWQGKQHALQDFAGKTVILNFWASWCPPCIKEFPILIDAAQQRPDDIVLIALSSDIDAGSMKRFITRKLDLPKDADNIIIAFDKDQTITQGLYETFKLPETYIIDTKQNIRAKIIGADWTADDLEQYLDLLLGSTENDS